jgi:hypothetical protein
MTEAARSAEATGAKAAAKLPALGSGELKPVLIACLGGLLTAALLIGAVAAGGAAKRAGPTLDAVAKHELNDAILSLDPATAGTAANDARQCKTPLAFVTMMVAPGQPPASIRIRAGSYLSPSIRITESPRRVAVPFPAPYPTGYGTLSIEGSARGLNIWLIPGTKIETLDGAQAIPVTWTPKPPC